MLPWIIILLFLRCLAPFSRIIDRTVIIDMFVLILTTSNATRRWDVPWYPVHGYLKQQERWQATPLADGLSESAPLNSKEVNTELGLNIQRINYSLPMNSPPPGHFMKNNHTLFQVWQSQCRFSFSVSWLSDKGKWVNYIQTIFFSCCPTDNKWKWN